MLSRSLLVLVSALAVASASPVGPPGGPGRKPCSTSVTKSASVITSSASTSTSTSTSSAVASTTSIPGNVGVVTPTMPLAGDATELPVPTGALKRITLGHGIQNYSCSAVGANATSGGALAVLYDITDIYSTLTVDEWATISVNLLRDTDVPLNLVGNSVNQYAANVDEPYPAVDAPVTVDGVAGPLTAIGHHYFDTALLPTFDLYGASLLFKGGKTGDIKAPATADPGLLNTGAVDWLQLSDKGASVGLTQTYRIVTAGGNFLPCTSVNETFSVPYAAQYWFYL